MKKFLAMLLTATFIFAGTLSSVGCTEPEKKDVKKDTAKKDAAKKDEAKKDAK